MKYIDAEKLKAEIERQQKSLNNATGDYAEGRRSELDNLLSLLDTLGEEPDRDLEEAADRYALSVEGDYAWSDGPDHFHFGDLTDAFIAGAKWDREQMMNEHPPILDKYYKLPQKR